MTNGLKSFVTRKFSEAGYQCHTLGIDSSHQVRPTRQGNSLSWAACEAHSNERASRKRFKDQGVTVVNYTVVFEIFGRDGGQSINQRYPWTNLAAAWLIETVEGER